MVEQSSKSSSTTTNNGQSKGKLCRSNRPGSALPLRSMLLLLFLLSAPRGSVVEAAGGFRLCGLKLTMMLNAICKQQLCGGFIMNKRSLTPVWEPALAEDEGQEVWSNDGLPAKQHIQRHYLLQIHQMDNVGLMEGGGGTPAKRSYPYGAFGTSKKSGIATECCSKRCTLAYMKTYCCTGSRGVEKEEEQGEEENDEGGTAEQ